MGIFNCSLCGRACRTRDISSEVAPDRVIGTAGFCERDYLASDRSYEGRVRSRSVRVREARELVVVPLSKPERAVQQVVLGLPFPASDRHTILKALGIDHA